MFIKIINFSLLVIKTDYTIAVTHWYMYIIDAL